MKQGVFITFEGNDGSGKTTVCKAVRQGYETLVSMYPERIEVIDAEPCKEEVLKSAMECVLKVIKEHE